MIKVKFCRFENARGNCSCAAGRRADVHKVAFQFFSEKESGALRPHDGDTRAHLSALLWKITDFLQ